MDFLQRVGNCVMHVFADLVHWFCTWRVHQILLQELDSNIPHPYAMGRNVAFILQLGHPSVSDARAYLPNVAEVACLHCRPATANLGATDADLAQFLAAAPEGVIYLSMGSSVRSARLPDALLELFVGVFARLPRHHVLWTWAGNATALEPRLPPNVRVRSWLPQQDILGQRQLQLFITHGGLLSMHEAVYHGVPLLVLPVFCDHDVNAAKAVRDGYARRLELAHLTEEALYCAIYDVLHNDSYRRAVRRRRTLLLDQMSQPLRTAVHWTEYVIRHRGAQHLQAPGLGMSYFAYHSLDVLGLLLGALLVLLTILRGLCKCWQLGRKTKTA
ncbi:UDP-glucuronosyltransferase 2B14-like [Scaptodrosophila lebanonensis]|uniref:UDP-glucuronosyltransferase n=1 Tax=Drosophila lebanonensis TaxID=7225 RepID=A0A6J2SZW4_DROLE|nr:UDP-glucuronosyltransferase 2B14-like [Scaptodrosophila lebanonensis]